MNPFENGLFSAVQLAKIFADSKTFADAIPNKRVSDILLDYAAEYKKEHFDLKEFVQKHYKISAPKQSEYDLKPATSTEGHIKKLWAYLEKETPKSVIEGDSLLPLPHSFIVPGGRFQEVYYWDSYFTMLGLAASGEVQRIRKMVDNFVFLLKNYGHIPNGNRNYYLSRSQPPFFSLMVQLLAKVESDKSVLLQYLPFLKIEHDFWQSGVRRKENIFRRLVRSNDTSLNRYYDDLPTPRPESYREDYELAAHLSRKEQKQLYLNIRAAAESGWDFSSRWFADAQSLTSIETTHILPVDLNCLLYNLENTLAEAYSLKNNEEQTEKYQQLANNRKKAILDTFWSEKEQFFMDYHFVHETHTSIFSLAGVFPLFFGLATPQQAKAVASKIEAEFLQAGGLLSTLNTTGQQWDAPNGWAPLQWVAYKGLQQYGFHELATKIRQRWLTYNDKVFLETGKMMEKYNVLDINTLAGGGEYPNQDGFGWTNGVYLAMLEDIK